MSEKLTKSILGQWVLEKADEKLSDVEIKGLKAEHAARIERDKERLKEKKVKNITPLVEIKPLKKEVLKTATNGQWELLNKGEEELEKATGVELAEKMNKKPRFEHGSTIKIHKAITEQSTGNTHGYEVHETHADGKVTHHPNVPYAEIDSRMEHGRLRMGAENATKKHDLYHSATVSHSKRTVASPKGFKGPKHYTKIESSFTPAGEPHTKATIKKNEVTGPGLTPTSE